MPRMLLPNVKNAAGSGGPFDALKRNHGECAGALRFFGFSIQVNPSFVTVAT